MEALSAAYTQSQKGKQASQLSAQNAGQESDLSAQNAGQAAAAVKALKGYIDPQGKYQPGTESAGQSASQQQELDQALKIVNDGGGTPGRKMNVKIGSTDVSEAQASPTAAYLKAGMGGSQVYNQGQKPLNDELDAVETIRGATTRNDAGSLGAARAGILSSNGFKRFNTPEAYASAPDSIQSKMDQILQVNGLPTFGKDPQGAGTLNADQIQNLNNFATDKIGSIRGRHEQLKALTTANYKLNPLANPQGDPGTALGAPLDARISQIEQSFKPMTPVPFKNGAGPMALPGAPQTPTPQQPPSDLDDIQGALQRKAQKALQQQSKQPQQGQAPQGQ
jgi:hypothetical protein